MKDFASCFSDHAVKVSDSSCSGSSSSSSSCGSKSSIVSVDSSSSVQTSITTLYRTTHNNLLIKLTWSKTPIGPVLSIAVLDDDDDLLYNHPQQRRPSTSTSTSSSINSQVLLRKRKGTRCYYSSGGAGGSSIGLYWDYSNAKFSTSSPEPVSNFYVLVVIGGAELGLLLGDLGSDYIKKRFHEDMISTAEFSMVSRKEQVLGQEVYSTKARFSEEGKDHEIVIRCKGYSSLGGSSKEKTSSSSSSSSELMVSIDKKSVVQVRRLQWNFRGNQTIFVDGSPVDMMWDVRDWWFSSPPGYAVFMFRKRSALESRLWWFEEEEMLLLHKQRGISTSFSLLIQAFKMPS